MTFDETQLKAAHKACSHHREALQKSDACGCFHCEAVFAPASIREYTDGGQTALCPKCSIDSVIPAQAGWELTGEFLTAMRVYWFE
jgi:uncharacterized paraquat-inducible protein A